MDVNKTMRYSYHIVTYAMGHDNRFDVLKELNEYGEAGFSIYSIDRVEEMDIDKGKVYVIALVYTLVYSSTNEAEFEDVKHTFGI